ncbi:hypothetical protein CAC01_00165 [Streptomyces sp. CLI2509]|nr:hypothetical protein CAC01_00165 [Streptomyces sp. CLI2509]
MLEVGTWRGRSTLLIADAARAAGVTALGGGHPGAARWAGAGSRRSRGGRRGTRTARRPGPSNGGGATPN